MLLTVAIAYWLNMPPLLFPASLLPQTKQSLLLRDIKRYQPPKTSKHLILFPKGFTNAKGNLPKNAWNWIIENYPAVSNHLKPFEEKGKKRYDKGDYWWELRSCDYYIIHYIHRFKIPFSHLKF
jgi:hypothetical protein